MRSRQRRPTGAATGAGFSLIELLVVITILGALAAGGTVFIRIAEKNKAKATTGQRLDTIATGLETVKGALGFYPGANLRDLKGPGNKEKVGEKVGVPNDTNVGCETLYIAFNMDGVMPDLSGIDDKGFMNTDEDEVVELVGRLQKTELYEFVDYWGSPFVYFAAKDYKDPDAVAKYINYKGEEVTAKPRTSEKTGQFARSTTFQLFSMGPDGLPNTDDDIIKWAE